MHNQARCQLEEAEAEGAEHWVLAKVMPTTIVDVDVDCVPKRRVGMVEEFA